MIEQQKYRHFVNKIVNFKDSKAIVNWKKNWTVLLVNKIANFEDSETTPNNKSWVVPRVRISGNFCCGTIGILYTIRQYSAVHIIAY